MGARGKRGRGRPHMVPLSPVTIPIPSEATGKDTPLKVAEELSKEETKNEKEDLEDEIVEETETLETKVYAKKEDSDNKVVKTDRKLWVDVLSENCNSSKGLTIQYVAPKLINEKMEI
ncbi:unnamed protein product [Lathyrus sativus]|nr:unnamed protein product [Lathyrus sativus]